MPDPIRFYKTGDDYGAFSNFARYPSEIDGKLWPTVEHYFQAQKFAGTEHEEAMRVEPSPMMVARMGRDRQKPLRSDWEAVKDDLMRRAVSEKFAQHPELRNRPSVTSRTRLEYDAGLSVQRVTAARARWTAIPRASNG